jgi:3-oxoadipate enol-lactonase
MRKLLLINGYAATGADWDPTLLAGLEAGFELVHPDNRGFGEAALGGKELTIELLAEDMARLIESFEAGPVAVAGWSMGGFVAQQLAASRPDLVSHLVLLSTDPGGPGAVRAPGEVLERLYDHGGTPDDQARRMLSLLFPPELADRVYDEVGEVVAAGRAQLSAAALSAEELAMARWYAEPGEQRLAAIAAPTLVMAGELDQVIPAENSLLLAAGIRDARREEFPGGGHAFIAQEPERVARAIGDFA